MFQDWLPWLHEQAVPHLQPGPATTAASVAARLAAGEASGTVHRRRDRAVGFVEDPGRLHTSGWARDGGLPSGDDGACAVVRLLCGCGEFAQAGKGDLRGCGVPVFSGGPASGSRFHRQLPADAFAGTGRIVHAGLAIVREGGTKLKANASKHKAMSYDRMQEKEKQR